MKTLEELQGRLYQAAKADRTRKFYTLHDKICRIDVLKEAWKRVAANKGSAGIDSTTIEDIERDGLDRFLSELQHELMCKTYRVSCVKRVFIPKPDGEKRPLGIPTVTDRIVQQAVRLIIEPIFEADFQEFSYGYRPKRSARDASLAIYRWLNYGLTSVADVDIEGFFDSIDHSKLISFVMERIADGYIIKLIREWLRAGAVYIDSIVYPEEGTPQGGVISPLLANIYLNKLDMWWNELRMNNRYAHNAQLVRYADDMVILTNKDAAHAMEVLAVLLAELKLRMNADKSKIVTAEEGFDFLGFHFRRRFYMRNGKQTTRFFPSRRSVSKFKEKVKAIASKRLAHVKSEKHVVEEMNKLIIGWSNYYNHGNASETYNRLQHFVEWKVRKFICYRHKIRRLAASHDHFDIPQQIGLARLAGRIAYAV